MPVAPVAARVDPVVAQAAGIAPGADRVRVHAQHLGRARDAQRRVERSRMEQIHLRQILVPPGRFVKLWRRAYLPHISCQWVESTSAISE